VESVAAEKGELKESKVKVYEEMFKIIHNSRSPLPISICLDVYFGRLSLFTPSDSHFFVTEFMIVKGSE